jgi:hypothetical protein
MIELTQEMKQKALEAKKAKMAYAQENLQLEYGDEGHWRELAKKYNLRLPVYYHPNTDTKYLKRAMKRLNVEPRDYLEACGVKSLKQLSSLNPTWTAFAEVGLLLEYIEDNTSSMEN